MYCTAAKYFRIAGNGQATIANIMIFRAKIISLTLHNYSISGLPQLSWRAFGHCISTQAAFVNTNFFLALHGVGPAACGASTDSGPFQRPFEKKRGFEGAAVAAESADDLDTERQPSRILQSRH